MFRIITLDKISSTLRPVQDFFNKEYLTITNKRLVLASDPGMTVFFTKSRNRLFRILSGAYIHRGGAYAP